MLYDSLNKDYINFIIQDASEKYYKLKCGTYRVHYNKGHFLITYLSPEM